MAEDNRKDADNHPGGGSTSLKEQLDGLAAALDDIARSETAEAVAIARAKGHDLLMHVGSLIVHLEKKAGKARTASIAVRGGVEEAICEKPLLAVVLAAAAGFLLASLRKS